MAENERIRTLTAEMKDLKKQVGNLEKRMFKLEQKTTPERLSRDIGKYLARQTQRPTSARIARY